jgi:hypothetical protein
MEERGCIPTVLGTSTPVTRIDCSASPIRPEVRPIPKRYRPEQSRLNFKLARRAVTFQKRRPLEPFENPEGEIDIDAERSVLSSPAWRAL